jgi:hypothetical protein
MISSPSFTGSPPSIAFSISSVSRFLFLRDCSPVFHQLSTTVRSLPFPPFNPRLRPSSFIDNCANKPDLSFYEQTYLTIYAADAAARLTAAAPGSNITTANVLALMQLCGFDSEYNGELSEFCGLFMKEEWEASECTLLFDPSSLPSRFLPSVQDRKLNFLLADYYDLDKYYSNGYGNLLGPINGCVVSLLLLFRLLFLPPLPVSPSCSSSPSPPSQTSVIHLPLPLAASATSTSSSPA